MRKMREAGIARALLLLDVNLRGSKPYHVALHGACISANWTDLIHRYPMRQR